MPDKKLSGENERFAKVFDLLEKNADKDFVKRILDPQNSDAIINEDGSQSTHRMGIAEADGVHYVFPTIIKDDFGTLKDFTDPKDKWAPFREALRRNEAIGFKTAKEAEWFERNWKVVWGHPARK